MQKNERAIISRIYLMTVINSLSKENYNKDNKEKYCNDEYKLSIYVD